MITSNNTSVEQLQNEIANHPSTTDDGGAFPTAYFSGIKKIAKQKKVNGVLAFLKKNHIAYVESNVANVVIIGGKVHLSLQYKTNEAGYAMYKFRFEGSNTWYTSSRYKFVENVLAGKYF